MAKKIMEKIKQQLIKVLTQVVILLQKQLKILQTQVAIKQAPDKNEIIYQTAKSLLGQKLGKVRKDLRCAEAVNEIFFQATGKPVGGTTSTLRMYNVLRKEKRFQKIYEPVKGCLIISPTGWGNGRIESGHCGIMGEDCIYSNNSDTGLLDTKWTLGAWKAYYGFKGGFPVEYYILKG